MALQAASLAETAAARQPLQMRNGEDEEGKEESEEGKAMERCGGSEVEGSINEKLEVMHTSLWDERA